MIFLQFFFFWVRLIQNLFFSFLHSLLLTPLMEIEVLIQEKNFKCVIIEKPFFDPKKQITSKTLK